MILANKDLFSSQHFIHAGKLRRYHDESWLQRLLDVKTIYLNILDLFRSFIGFLQALLILIRFRPDAVFIKGGYVSVPLGLATALLRVPYITHDSDTVAGLTNRIIGRWAKINATGMPKEYYAYPEEKKHFTGIPISKKFQPVSTKLKKVLREEQGINSEAKILLVTGGSQGSQRINMAAAKIVPKLTEQGIFVIHHVGKGNENLYGEFKSPNLRVVSFLDDFYKVTAVSDVIVARCGANTIAELALQGKPAIFIPSPFLAGGHQLKNAEYIKGHNAAIIINEDDLILNPEVLLESVEELLNSPLLQAELSKNLSALGLPNAANKIAKLIIETARL